MYYAIESANVKIVKFLMEKGAQPNEKYDSGNKILKSKYWIIVNLAQVSINDRQRNFFATPCFSNRIYSYFKHREHSSVNHVKRMK